MRALGIVGDIFTILDVVNEINKASGKGITWLEKPYEWDDIKGTYRIATVSKYNGLGGVRYYRYYVRLNYFGNEAADKTVAQLNEGLAGLAYYIRDDGFPTFTEEQLSDLAKSGLFIEITETEALRHKESYEKAFGYWNWPWGWMPGTEPGSKTPPIYRCPTDWEGKAIVIG